MDKELCGTSFTGQKLEKLLLTTLCNSRDGHAFPLDGLRLVNVDARLMDIQGNVSDILQISLTWNNRDAAVTLSAPETVIVKCPKTANLQRMLDKAYNTADGNGVLLDVSAQIQQIHNDEVAIYELLYSGEKENELVRIPIPRFFGAAKIEDGQPCSEGVLIMEDMTKFGSVMKTLGSKWKQSQLEHLTDALANLHAWSYILWNGKEKDYKVPSIQDRWDRWTQFTCSWTLERIREYKVEYPDIFANAPEEKILDLLSAGSFFKAFVEEGRDAGLPVVLVHGDIHRKNVLFSKEANDDDRLVGLIDWQLAHKGYGPEDLARLLTLCSSNELKRTHGDYILRRYVEAFNATLKGTALKPISYENMKTVFTRMYAFMAMTFALSVIGFVDRLVEGVDDEQEKTQQKRDYIQHCDELYRDAVETLGW